jgi:class I fructose-bisphosphate aldolase
MMTKRVREILSYYDSDNGSVRNNLARMLNHGKLAGTGKFVILPVDQGFEHGPARSFAMNPAAYDPRYHFQLAIDAGCNAFAAPLGLLEAGVAEYAGEIPLILKANNHDVLNDEKDPEPSMTASVKDALRLGAAAVGLTIYPGSAKEKSMYEEARAMGEEAKANGLPAPVSASRARPRSTWWHTPRKSPRNLALLSSRSSRRRLSSNKPRPKKFTTARRCPSNRSRRALRT